MCGIGGIFSVRDNRASIKRLTDAIHHRGPDDVGIAELLNAGGDTRGSFGHRRLAIIDLSPAGHQPMFTADSRLCVTYNGEIYNYSELRDELAREGVQFHSTCDTEVLLLGWRLHGIAFLQRLRGMYAFAIWDSDRDVGVIARDPFGIKPLYYAESNGEVIFASEVRAIAATERISPQLSRDAVASYLAAGSVAEPLTILDGVYALPPGCVATVDMRSGSAVMSPPERFTAARLPPFASPQ